ncbi:membrane hypothetical protein [Frankia sp. AiPs1]
MAGYTVLSRRMLDAGATVIEVTTIAVLLSGILLLPLVLESGVGWLGTASGAAMAGYLGVATSALGFWLNARGLTRATPASVATLNLAEPMTAVVLAFAILGERPNAVQAVGAATVGLGLVLIARENKPTPSPQVDEYKDHGGSGDRPKQLDQARPAPFPSGIPSHRDGRPENPLRLERQKPRP